jgi:hypothetical protein
MCMSLTDTYMQGNGGNNSLSLPLSAIQANSPEDTLFPSERSVWFAALEKVCTLVPLHCWPAH